MDQTRVSASRPSSGSCTTRRPQCPTFPEPSRAATAPTRSYLPPPGMDELASPTSRGATPSRMGLHRAVRAGVHGHHPGVPRTVAGQPVAEDQLARGDRAGAQQPGARCRHRRPAGDVREPVLRQDERPHLVAAGHAAAVDGHRPGRWFARRPGCRAGAQRRGRPRRMVHRPGRSSTRCSRPRSPYCPTRSRSTNAVWSRASWASACRSPRWARPSWSSCSPATGSPCSWPRARSAGSSSCSSRSC